MNLADKLRDKERRVKLGQKGAVASLCAVALRAAEYIDSADKVVEAAKREIREDNFSSYFALEDALDKHEPKWKDVANEA